MDKKITLLINFLEVKNYSPASIKAYVNALRIFLNYFGDQDIDNLSRLKIERFINDKVNAGQISIAYQKQLAAVVKFYYNGVLHKNINFTYLYPYQKEPSIPFILSQQEVKDLLGSIKNIKHKAILSTCYACGLKVSEVINLKLSDIDYNDMRIIIRKVGYTKGRTVMLSQRLADLLHNYLQEYRPRVYLFEGYNLRQYSIRSVQQIFKHTLKANKISKDASVHTLRHSYAIHLLEKGIDVHFVQQLLGHQSVKTTMRYIQLIDIRSRKIISPFDNL